MFFYLFSFFIILAASLVVFCKNPVHSTLSLIFAFMNSAGLLILLGAEFLAMMIVIVYVGAVAVLFLFVIMMLDIDYESVNTKTPRLVMLGGVILSVACILMVIVLLNLSNAQGEYSHHQIFQPDKTITNTHMIAQVLYTDYIIAFQTAGVILLVAIIGAISLTSKNRIGIKKQDPDLQIARENFVELVEIKPNSSVKGIDYGV